MAKINFKPGNMLYPLPAVLISCGDFNGESNLLTVAWAGTICTNPPMVSVSIRPERYSYRMIRDTKEFVINLTTKILPMPLTIVECAPAEMWTNGRTVN